VLVKYSNQSPRSLFISASPISSVKMPTIPLYYSITGCAMIAMWLLFSIFGGDDFHRRGIKNKIATVPSWCHGRSHIVTFFLRRPNVYRFFMHLPPVLMIGSATLNLSGVLPWAHGLMNWACTIAFSLYSLCESSVTHSHRDYATLWILWGCVLLPSDLARGFGLGICVMFISASGFSKVIVGGGLSFGLHHGTLKAILDTYSKLEIKDCGPLSLTVNRLVAGSPTLTTGFAAATLLFECIFVPLSLLLPHQFRIIMLVMLVKMHFGIAVVQSLVVGLAFLPCVGSYYFGFGAEVVIGTPAWWLAVMVATIVPIWYFMTGQLIAEDWPLTPFALFAWSEQQWRILFHRFASGNTFLVFTVDTGHQKAEKILIGKHIVHKSADSLPSTVSNLASKPQKILGPVVYNGWEQAIGETLVYNGVWKALAFSEMVKENWDATKFVSKMEIWLAKEKLVEIHSGEPLLRAYYVQVDQSSGKVLKILAKSSINQSHDGK